MRTGVLEWVLEDLAGKLRNGALEYRPRMIALVHSGLAGGGAGA